MRNTFQFKKLFLLFGDIAVLYLSLYLSLAIRYQAIPTEMAWGSHFWPFTLIFSVWLVILYVAGLYNLHLAVNNADFWRLVGKSLLVGTLVAVAFFYLVPGIGIAPKTTLLIELGVFAVIFGSWRQFYNWLLAGYLPKNYLAIIGFNDQVKELIKELKGKQQLGYRIAFIIDDQNTGQAEYLGLPLHHDASQLTDLARDHKITTIILSSDPHQSAELRNALFACLPLKLNYVSLPLFYENLTGRVPVSVINQMWFLENLAEGGKAIYDTMKLIADFVIAILVLVITSPFWILIAIIIKLESKGPVFFQQVRLGQNGGLFTMIKFRTMREVGNDYAPTVTGDTRVTSFGSFLRKSRIDEIPQVINIIKGEMSFIGPRPERPELVKELETLIPFYRERMLVKPGVTGWDQVSGEYHSPSFEDTLKKLQFDLYYIKNRSIYLDLSITLKTIATVLSRAGL